MNENLDFLTIINWREIIAYNAQYIKCPLKYVKKKAVSPLEYSEFSANKFVTAKGKETNENHKYRPQ